MLAVPDSVPALSSLMAQVPVEPIVKVLALLVVGQAPRQLVPVRVSLAQLQLFLARLQLLVPETLLEMLAQVRPPRLAEECLERLSQQAFYVVPP